MLLNGAVCRGYEAARAGRQIGVNPYRWRSREWRDWRIGFWLAHQDARNDARIDAAIDAAMCKETGNVVRYTVFPDGGSDALAGR